MRNRVANGHFTAYAQGWRNRWFQRRMSDGLQALTERERETLRLLLVGHDAKSISRQLGLSVHTVNERLREARRKLGVSSSRQAARLLAESEQHDPQFSGDRQLGVAAAPVRAESHGPLDQVRGRGRSLVWLGGGALIMLSILAAVVLSSALQATAEPSRSSPVATPAKVAETLATGPARKWVGLLDDKRWGESWAEAGVLFKTQLSEANWSSTIQTVRLPLGSVSSRTLQTVTKATSLPGAPDGEYEIVQFATNFEKKHGAVETVVLAREPSGWRVNGYFIK